MSKNGAVSRFRIFPAEAEERILARRQIRAWARAGLLKPEQVLPLLDTLATDWRVVKSVMRGLLFVFSLLATAAFVWLLFMLRILSNTALSCLLLCALFYFAAEYGVRRMRFYRCGVELMLLLASVLALSIAVVELPGLSFARSFFTYALAAALAGWTFVRFGHLLLGWIALLLSGLAMASLGNFFGAWQMEASFVLLVTTLIGAWKFCERRLGRASSLLLRFEWEGLATGVFTLAYLVSNIELPPLFSLVRLVRLTETFSWLAYALTWLLPLIALRRAVLQRRKSLLWAAGVALLLTISTNKSFLHMTRQPWDPMLFGALLLTVSLLLRRWLDRGRQKTMGGHPMRGGYTAERVSSSDAVIVEGAMAVQALALPTGARAAGAPPSEAPSSFGGGRSGGGGAQGTY